MATNALLERKGDATLLVVTKGFRDQLRIAYQARPRLFDKEIILPEMLYERIEEVIERVDARDQIITPLNLDDLAPRFKVAFDNGLRSIAIVLMHGYRVPAHELAIAALAREIGFTQISTSHGTSPMIKFVGRGGTTVADAYLSPMLRRYINRLARDFDQAKGTKLQLMQSNGGLTDASLFSGARMQFYLARLVGLWCGENVNRQGLTRLSLLIWAALQPMLRIMKMFMSACLIPSLRE